MLTCGLGANALLFCLLLSARRPALTVGEEDRMNAERQEQVYTGRTLAPPQYVENVRKVRRTTAVDLTGGPGR